MLSFYCLLTVILTVTIQVSLGAPLASIKRPEGKHNYDVVVYLTATSLTSKQMYTGFIAEQQGYGNQEVLKILDKELEKMASTELYGNFGEKDLLWFDYDQETKELHGILGLTLDGDSSYITRTWVTNKHIRVLDLLTEFGKTTTTCPLAIKIRGQTFQKCAENEAVVAVDLATDETAELQPDTAAFESAGGALIGVLTQKVGNSAGDISVHHFVEYGSASKKSGSATMCVTGAGMTKGNMYKKQFDTIKKMKEGFVDKCKVNFAWISGPDTEEEEGGETTQPDTQQYIAIASAKMPSTKEAMATFMQTQIQGRPDLYIGPYLCNELFGCKGKKKKALINCDVKQYELEEEEGIIEAQLIMNVDTSKLTKEESKWSDVSDWAIAKYLQPKGKDVELSLYHDPSEQQSVQIYSGPVTDQSRKILFQVMVCEATSSQICSTIRENFEGSNCVKTEDIEDFEDCLTQVYQVDVPVIHFEWVKRVADPWKVILRFKEKLESDLKTHVNVGFRTNEKSEPCD